MYACFNVSFSVYLGKLNLFLLFLIISVSEVRFSCYTVPQEFWIIGQPLKWEQVSFFTA